MKFTVSPSNRSIFTEVPRPLNLPYHSNIITEVFGFISENSPKFPRPSHTTPIYLFEYTIRISPLLQLTPELEIINLKPDFLDSQRQINAIKTIKSVGFSLPPPFMRIII